MSLKEGEEADDQKDLVPMDGSDHSRKPVEHACDLPIKSHASLYLFHVIHRSHIPEEFF